MQNGSKNHQKAINGFIFVILAVIGFGIYCVWMTIPEPTLHKLQFTYYPDKYWGIAAPGLVIMIFLFLWSAYVLMYIRNTKPLTSIFTIADQDSKAKIVKGATLGGLNETRSSVPPFADIPVSVTSHIFYQPWQ